MLQQHFSALQETLWVNSVADGRGNRPRGLPKFEFLWMLKLQSSAIDVHPCSVVALTRTETEWSGGADSPSASAFAKSCQGSSVSPYRYAFPLVVLQSRRPFTITHPFTAQ